MLRSSFTLAHEWFGCTVTTMPDWASVTRLSTIHYGHRARACIVTSSRMQEKEEREGEREREKKKKKENKKERKKEKKERERERIVFAKRAPDKKIIFSGNFRENVVKQKHRRNTTKKHRPDTKGQNQKFAPEKCLQNARLTRREFFRQLSGECSSTIKQKHRAKRHQKTPTGHKRPKPKVRSRKCFAKRAPDKKIFFQEAFGRMFQHNQAKA